MDGIAKTEWLVDDLDKTDEINQTTADLIQHETEEAWAKMLQTEAGRLIAWSILDNCHVFSTTYTGNAAQNFLEGERSVGLKILKGFILPQGNHLLGDMMDEASARFDRLSAVAEFQANGEDNG